MPGDRVDAANREPETFSQRDGVTPFAASHIEHHSLRAQPEPADEVIEQLWPAGLQAFGQGLLKFLLDPWVVIVEGSKIE